ncbi:uncharacterized protein LOC114350978, partial [Ostrinia furnacalis]|uniref:uncharacterized protein LOC114350978 n=1 Tax=Ostrinia furnacalis TaxID=93504 RepID=UPI00103CE9C2
GAITVSFVTKPNAHEFIFKQFQSDRDREAPWISGEDPGLQHYGTPQNEWLRRVYKPSEHRKTRRRENSFEEATPFSGVKFVRQKRDLGANVLITQRFSEKIVTPGEDISLQCSATAVRPPRFIWERDGVVISSNTEPRYLTQTFKATMRAF